MAISVIAENTQLATHCVSDYLIFEWKNYVDRVAIVGFLF